MKIVAEHVEFKPQKKEGAGGALAAAEEREAEPAF